MNLIDKNILIEEIERRYAEHDADYNNGDETELHRMVEDRAIINYIDSLEVKEVDLENEIENLLEKEKAFVTDNREVKYYNGDSFNHIYELEFIAKHFYELGIKAQKGEEI